MFMHLFSLAVYSLFIEINIVGRV